MRDEGEKKKRRKEKMEQLYEETSCPARSIGYDRLPLSMKETGYCKIKSGYRGLVARRKIYTTISYPVFSRSKMSRDRAKCWRYFFYCAQFDRKSKGFVPHGDIFD